MSAGWVGPGGEGVTVAGVAVLGVPPFRGDANTVFRSYALFPHMKVEDNVAYALKMQRVGRRERRRRAGGAGERRNRVHGQEACRSGGGGTVNRFRGMPYMAAWPVAIFTCRSIIVSVRISARPAPESAPIKRTFR